ncbi:MAG: hypothetical protein GF329_14185, partial [Candidatus Lokiarchaeota archaeon]|nr:hypothetical protein [Candidatus Lokiarchaeota archaeon]
ILDDEEVLRTNSRVEDDLKNKDIENHFDPDWIADKVTYDSILKEIKEAKPRDIFKWEAEISVEVDDFDDNLDIITIRFINLTSLKVSGLEPFLFNCRLKIDLGANNIEPFTYRYDYEGYKYSSQGNLRTLNCHADYFKSENYIKTKPFSIYEQQKIVPRTEINGIKALFSDLSGSLEPLNLLLRELINQHANYKNHEIYDNDSHPNHKQFLEETINFGKIILRYKKGVEILNRNDNARRAFFLMNKVFEQVSDFKGWRVFQIIFIVMIIPDIVDLERNRDLADILHVNTGGGKSEAYFGIVLFLLFWDRLRGKSLGVSAITKFPLRMLSIQQLQRIAKIIVVAEELRKKNKISGENFSVGYYVGVSEEFPRFSFVKIQEIKKAKRNGNSLRGILLDICPLCGSSVYLDVVDEEDRIIHVCEGCNRKFYLYFTNDEIYRFLPSFIVSTVDKLASVALNRRFKNLMGGKLSVCSKGHGFIPKNDKCEVKIGMKASCDGESQEYTEEIEGPTLMIQDEMHLLREGFGTIDSHFESLLNTMLKKLSGKEFKYISLTATISGAENQIDNLYGKDYFLFPGRVPRGYDISKDLFFSHEEDSDGNPIIQRILIGLKPNLRDNQYASLLTIRHISDFLKEVKNNLQDFANRYGISVSELEEHLKRYQCLLTYHGKKADVYGMNYFLLPVVTSKLEDFNISAKPLTGNNTLAEIKEAISVINQFPDDPKNEKKLHTTFATSVVSHGVDINNWNLMIFQGMTRNTSEYIQALSRVGRSYTGIIFLWFYPNRVRDLSYYKNFQHYHKTLQFRVEKTPLSRWTKLGFKQTITSIFCASILNYISDEAEQPIYTVNQVNSYFEDRKEVEKLIKFIRNAYYSNYKKVGAQWIRDKISDEVEERVNYLKKYTNSKNKFFFPNALRDCENPYFKTQYGMRGIQAEVCLRLQDDYVEFVKKYQKGE